ncbi:hypothetical protein HO173_011392 [Letharia columbiana]|uniref:Peroxisomal-coenzyme A synthetase n=1 Tax=Letharia columbiana TaxID=112416 RepID=A0A8H6FJ87_9LECA|nr:uncharacterized protein HO173_011392 [Letharia columbiana]KAF6229537.1 hypothetical protein HO173_011392 [Letharia columbiana]
MATLSTTLPTTGHTPAIIVPGKPDTLSISFQQLNSHVLTFQKNLAHLGIAPQAAVSIALPNSYEFIVAFLAASWQRAIAAPLNPAYKQEEFEFYIDDLSSAVTLVPRGSFYQDGPAVRAARKYKAAVAECYWNGHEVVLEIKDSGKLSGKEGQEVQKAQPDDIALVLHTSGTTGRPKAVPLTHRNLTRTMKNVQTTYKLTSNDRTLLVMPLFHVHGLLAGLLAPLFSGGSVIVPSRFSASEFWDNFITYKANWYTAVPTIHQILLRNPPPSNMPEIRFIRSCSSPLSPKTFSELERAFNAPVLEAYAMTEGAHQMTSNPLPPAKRYPGSVGIGQGVEVKILNAFGSEVPQGGEAEICIRGENVTKGYLNNPEANKTSFTQDGFFRTGDQGKQDEDGYVIITGRIKELINKGGEKISPVELDNVVSQNPSVAEAVCFAIADEMYGQDIGLAVVVKDGEKTTPEELRKWIATKVAKFKVPKQIFLTDNMPKTPTGKVQRRMVAEAMLKQQKPKAKL